MFQHKLAIVQRVRVVRNQFQRAIDPAQRVGEFLPRDGDARDAVVGAGHLAFELCANGLERPIGAEDGSGGTRFVAELADFFLEFHRQRYRFDGAPIHDAMAVAHVIDPSLVETLHCNIEIETRSDFCDGRTVVDRWLVRDAPKNAQAGIDVDSERFLELLVSRLASLP